MLSVKVSRCFRDFSVRHIEECIHSLIHHVFYLIPRQEGYWQKWIYCSLCEWGEKIITGECITSIVVTFLLHTIYCLQEHHEGSSSHVLEYMGACRVLQDLLIFPDNLLISPLATTCNLELFLFFLYVANLTRSFQVSFTKSDGCFRFYPHMLLHTVLRIVNSSLDYCTSFLAGLPLSTIIQNASYF